MTVGALNESMSATALLRCPPALFAVAVFAYSLGGARHIPNSRTTSELSRGQVPESMTRSTYVSLLVFEQTDCDE